ncbi:MAG: hypothetical protein ACLQDF_15820 [Desulfomonilia bacterium]
MIQAKGCQNTTPNPSDNSQSDVQKGREFYSLSVHPNGEELFFVEVDRNRLHSKVLRYNLKNGRLQHYNLQDEAYAYMDAKISPSGKYVVMTRIPRLFSDEAKTREAEESAEIAFMKSDGTDFKVLNLSHGFKYSPIISNDDSKVAYWRGPLRPPHSKTLAIHLDIWEVDLNIGTDTLFAGPFEFFQGGQMQYLPGDGEIMAHADTPRARLTREYYNKSNNSNVYKISRGQTEVPDPILTEIRSASYPLTDRAGNLYFRGERPGASLFKKTPQGKIEQWKMPHEFVNIVSSCVAPDGSYVAFIYFFYGKSPLLRGLGMLDTKTSQWRTLSIPPFNSSSPIAVKVAQ